MDLKILSLKTSKLLEFHNSGSKMFYSVIEEVEKLFLKNIMSNVKKENITNGSRNMSIGFFRYLLKTLLRIFACVNFVKHS